MSEPAFGRIGGPECPTCLGRGLRCHPDGGLIGCDEGCPRCDDAVRRRAEVLMEKHPIEVDEEGAMRILRDLGYIVTPACPTCGDRGVWMDEPCHDCTPGKDQP